MTNAIVTKTDTSVSALNAGAVVDLTAVRKANRKANRKAGAKASAKTAKVDAKESAKLVEAMREIKGGIARMINGDTTMRNGQHIAAHGLLVVAGVNKGVAAFLRGVPNADVGRPEIASMIYGVTTIGKPGNTEEARQIEMTNTQTQMLSRVIDFASTLIRAGIPHTDFNHKAGFFAVQATKLLERGKQSLVQGDIIKPATKVLLNGSSVGVMQKDDAGKMRFKSIQASISLLKERFGSPKVKDKATRKGKAGQGKGTVPSLGAALEVVTTAFARGKVSTKVAKVNELVGLLLDQCVEHYGELLASKLHDKAAADAKESIKRSA